MREVARPVKYLLVVILVLSGLAAQTPTPEETMTGRQFYNELKAASGLNPLFTTVCFRPDRPDAFDLIGFTKQFETTARAKGIPLTAKERKAYASLDGLMTQTYVKGIASGEDMLTQDKVNREQWHSYSQVKGHRFHLIVSLSPVGRYRRSVYVDNGFTPSAEGFGKCEPIQ